MTPLAVLVCQILLVADTARRAERAWTGVGSQLAERLLAAQVLAIAQVVAVCLVLGYGGWLRSVPILLAHAALWLAAVATDIATSGRRLPAVPIARAVRASLGAWPDRERMLGLALAGWVLALVVTGAVGHHLTHDALAYRLSRIGYWLQEGSIRHFPTNDSRQSYSAVNADLVMLWFTHPFRQGFPLTTLAQAWGGLLVLLATWATVARVTPRRSARLGAVALLLGTPCVLVQFMTTQNDLFVAGMLSAAVAAAVAASTAVPIRAGMFVIGWMALGLALGAKGTAFYFMPGLGLLGVLLLRHTAISRPQLVRQALLAAVCVGLFGAPRYVENLLAWGNPFAPAEDYAVHEPPVRWGLLGHKLALDGLTYLSQTVDPSSNPAVLATLLRGPWRVLSMSLPDFDPHAPTVYPRRLSVRHFSQEPLQTADTLSTGTLLPLLAVIGASIALARSRRAPHTAETLLVALAAAAIAFLTFFSALFLWWPSNVRFFSLTAVPLAALAAYALDLLPRRARGVAWASVAALQVGICSEVYGRTLNAGWQSLAEPSASRVEYWGDYQVERFVARALPDGSTLGVSLPGYHVLAGLFRTGHDIRVRFIPTQSLARVDAGTMLRSQRLTALLTLAGVPAGDAESQALITFSRQVFVVFTPRHPAEAR